MADDDLHPLDARIIELLSADARMTNAALAEELGSRHPPPTRACGRSSTAAS